MKYASVCSGVEAATLAWHPLGWEPLWYSEIEPFPSAVLAHRYPNTPNLGDMTKINGGKYRGKIDVLVGGTPCQSFSVAGGRKGLEDPRGQLMLKFVELAYNCAVPWVVWENVPGVFSQDGGRAFQCLLSCLCGWDVPIPAGGWKSFGISTGMPGFFGVAWRVLDAQYVRVDGFPRAVPQRRRRVFVVGYLGDWRPAAEVLFESQSVLGYTPPRRVKGKGFASDVKIGADPASEVGTIRCHGVIDSYADCYDGTRSCTLCARDAKGGQCVVEQAVAIAENIIGRKVENGGNGTGAQEELSYTLNATGVHGVAQNATVRRLTPVECERLMGFPDDYTKIPWQGKPPEDCPDAHRYKACGNSMCVNVMRWIGLRIAQVAAHLKEMG